MVIILCFLLIIGSYLVAICMAGCAITPDSNGHVTIPNTWTNIPGDGSWPYTNSAFYMCTSLKSVTIPDSVKYIGQGAFMYCTALQSVTIPDSVTTIYGHAFIYCRALRRILT